MVIQYAVPALSVKRTWLLMKGAWQHCWRNHRQNCWNGRKSSGIIACTCCIWYGYYTCSWITPHTLACTPHVPQLVFSEHRYGNFSTLLSMRSSTACRKRANCTRRHDATISRVKCLWDRKSKSRGYFSIYILNSCCNFAEDFSWNLVHISIFLEYVVVHFKHSRQLRNNTCLHIQFSSHASVRDQPTITLNMKILLLNEEGGCDKRKSSHSHLQL
jgi:hypothetical protein